MEANPQIPAPVLRKFSIEAPSEAQWDTQQVRSRVYQNKSQRLSPIDEQRLKIVFDEFMDKTPQLEKTIRAGTAIVAFFNRGDKQYVSKTFAKDADYQTELKWLTFFDQHPKLQKYIPKYDPLTFKNTIIYPRYISTTQLLKDLPNTQMNIHRLFRWNSELLRDVKDAGLVLCDHKCDNVLYDIDKGLFYLTDLEAIIDTKHDPQAQCNLSTFMRLQIDWSIAPDIKDQLHFLQSLIMIKGIHEATKEGIIKTSRAILDSAPLSMSIEQLNDVIEALMFAFFSVDALDV